MQVARVGIDEPQLLGNGFLHGGVTVSQRRDVVVHIQVLGTISVVELGALATHQVERVMVEQAVAWPQDRAALHQRTGMPVKLVEVFRLEAV